MTKRARSNVLILMLLIFSILATGCTESSTETLAARLKSDQFSVRKAAVKALAKKGEPAINPLIDALDDKDYDIVIQAEQALAEIGKPAVKPLIKTLQNHKSAIVRFGSTKALGRIADKRAVTPLIGAFHDKNHAVRAAARGALASMGGDIAGPQLIEAMSTEYPKRKDFRGQSNKKFLAQVYDFETTRDNAMETLSHMKDKTTAKLLRELLKTDYKMEAIEILGEIRDPLAVEPLIALLMTEEGIGDYDFDISIALEQIGKPAVRPLISIVNGEVETLENQDIETYMKIATIETLGLIKDKRAVPSLIDALKSDSEEVRNYADFALENYKVETYIRPLRITVVNGSLDIRSLSSDMLSRLGNREADEVLIERLRDTDMDVRYKAVIACANIDDRRVVEPLIKVYEGENYRPKGDYFSIRHEAGKALARIGGKQALEFLVGWARSGDQEALSALSELRKKRDARNLLDVAANGNDKLISVALGALGKIGGQEDAKKLLGYIYDENANVRSAALSSLSLLGVSTRQIRYLARALDDPDFRGNVGAIRVFGESGNEVAVTPLVQIVDDDKNVKHREEAIYALKELGDSQAADTLIAVLKDKRSYITFQDLERKIPLRYAAADALETIKSDKAAKVLVRILEEDEDKIVRQKAARTLGKIKYREAVGPLAKALRKDPDKGVRRSAANALGKIGDKRAVRALVLASRQKSAIGNQALEALADLGIIHSMNYSEDIYFW